MMRAYTCIIEHCSRYTDGGAFCDMHLDWFERWWVSTRGKKLPWWKRFYYWLEETLS